MRKLRIGFIGALIIVVAGALLWRAWQLHSRRQAFLHGELMVAVRKGDLATTKTLLGKGAGVNTIGGEWEEAPLHVAVGRGDYDIAKVLIDHGADVNALTQGSIQGETPLHCAASGGHVLIAELLIDHGADVNVNTPNCDTPLMRAAAHGHIGVAELLVARGADVNLKSPGTEYTALLLATFSNRVEVAEWLLDHGADLDATSATGDTALRRAVTNGNPQLVELFVSRGATVTFHIAAALGDLEKVKEFLADGASPNEQDRRGHRPLYYAVSGGHLAVAEELVGAGASLGVEGSMIRQSVLHVAAHNGDAEMVNLLIDAGADINARMRGPIGSPTPLDSALQAEHDDVSAILREHGGKTSRELLSPQGE